MDAFPRPTTLFNRAVGMCEKVMPSRTVTQEHIDCWRQSTCKVLSGMDGYDADVAGRVLNETKWKLESGRPPSDSWYGIAEFDHKRNERPRATLYEESAAAQLPTESLFHLAGMSGMDHLYGHLYPYHAGSQDYGENAACRLQYGLMVARAKQSTAPSVAPLFMKWLYRFHKHIPLSNYSGKVVLPENKITS